MTVAMSTVPAAKKREYASTPEVAAVQKKRKIVKSQMSETTADGQKEVTPQSSKTAASTITTGDESEETHKSKVIPWTDEEKAVMTHDVIQYVLWHRENRVGS